MRLECINRETAPGFMPFFKIFLKIIEPPHNKTICICQNKDAAQRLCFHYMDSTIPLLLKSKISSFQPSSVTVHGGLIRTWSKSQIVGFLMQRLN